VSERTAVASLFRALAPVLAGFGGRWYVFGAQAVMVWGRPRLTGDVDVTVHLEPDDPSRLVAAMGSAGFDLRVQDPDDFVRRTRVLPFVHRETDMPLDVVLAGPGLEEEFARDAVEVTVEGTPVPFISPVDLIVTKILAGRPKDLEDVRGIVLAQGDGLDVARVRRRLRQIEQALDQSDLTPLFEAQLRATNPKRT
jgi:hypothetical protein